MDVNLSTDPIAAAQADLIAVAAGPMARELGAPERALDDADPVAVVYREPVALAVIAVEAGADGLRAAAARAVRACPAGGAVAWALDRSSPVPVADQVRVLAEGAVLGGHQRGRWRSVAGAEPVRRFVICLGAGIDAAPLEPVAAGAAIVGRWCNVARELVDAPANVVTPATLAQRAATFDGLDTELIDPAAGGLSALATVGASGTVPPVLIVLRHRPADAVAGVRLALVGKAVTFDSGGYFLKSRTEIVRQKADMAGGAAVVAAVAAIAELGLPVAVTGVVCACENLLSGTPIRPTDVITTGSGLTVEVTNPDAEGRLILADGLWYARRDGATHVVDLATLTGGVPDALGDVHAGVFGSDPEWRDEVVAAGDAAGDPAWALPLHPRFQAWLESDVADLRNVAGRPTGFSIFAATFLARFAGDTPWAHVDMLGTATAAEDRGDGLGAGASGYGVRMLVELARRRVEHGADTAGA